jgi:hypothetical protein
MPTADERRALFLIRMAGGVVLVLFVLGTLLGPRAPVTANVPGFVNPVVGMELAAEPRDVFGLLGQPDSPARPGAVRSMRLATWLDFPFLVAYTALYLGIALLLVARQRLGGRVTILLFALPLVVGLADALENRQILLLTTMTDPHAMDAVLARLRLWTIVKWYGLYAVSGVVAVLVWRDPSGWRWSAPFFGTATVLGSVALAHLPAIEWSLLPLGVAWTITWIHALRASRDRASGRL